MGCRRPGGVSWACDTDPSVTSRRCPKTIFRSDRRRFRPDILDILALYGDFEQGHLYGPGGIADQPALYVEAMHFVRGVARAREAIEIEKHRRKIEEQRGAAGR